MNLYHGTNAEFQEIDLSKSQRQKDFGQGFYLSDNKEQAFEMGLHKVKQLGGLPQVQEYSFDESALSSSDVRVLRFEGYTKEWVNFIIANRENNSATPAHDYDIVIGPIANDTVGVQLFQYRKRYINIEMLIENLKYKKYTIQYYFGTSKALSYLIRK